MPDEQKNINIQTKLELFSHQYKARETELLKIIKLIPINQENIKNTSLFFTDFILKTCPLIENIFELIFEIKYTEFKEENFPKDSKDNERIGFFKRFATFCNKDFEITLSDFIDKNGKCIKFKFYNIALENQLKESVMSKKVIFGPFIDNNGKPINPNENKMAWWSLYNKIKHDMFHELVQKSSTYENALKVLGVSFISLNFLVAAIKDDGRLIFFTSLYGEYNGGIKIRLKKTEYHWVPSQTGLKHPQGAMKTEEIYRTRSKIFSDDFYWSIS